MLTCPVGFVVNKTIFDWSVVFEESAENHETLRSCVAKCMRALGEIADAKEQTADLLKALGSAGALHAAMSLQELKHLTEILTAVKCVVNRIASSPSKKEETASL